MTYLSIGIAYVVLYALVGWALAGHPFARSIFGSAGVAIPALAIVVVVARRLRDWAGCQRLFWVTIALGMALWTVGHAGWVFDEMIRHRVAWLQWHTLFTVCGGISPLIALLARPHRGVRPETVAAVGYDMTSYGLLALFVYADFVLIPNAVSNGGSEARFFTLIQANRLLLLIGMVAFAIASRDQAWRVTYSRIALGVGVGLLARSVTSAAILRGEYQSGTLYDVAWLAPWIAYGWAAQEAPASTAATEDAAHAARPPTAVFGAIPVFLIPPVGYGTIHVGSLGSAGESFRSLLASIMTVAGLGVLTLRLASQGGQLRRADSRLKLLAAATEQTRDLILITRADGRFEHANEAFLRAVGHTRAEVAAMKFDDLVERGGPVMNAHIAATVGEHGVWRGTILRRRKDGSTFPASCTVVALRGSSGEITHYVGVERDVTEELLLRDQLVHNERLSAVGELIAGVAHEINNPLQTIIGTVELMLEDGVPAPAGSPASAGAADAAAASRRDLEMIRREASRAGQIVRNLLAFIRRSAPDRALADLNDIVRTTVELRRYHLQQHDIRTVMHADGSPLPVLVNRAEIQQIILNMLLNAEQAIASPGSDSSSSRAGTITIRTSHTADVNIVEIADDGPGIKPEMRGRVFEPFFTTKPVGQGTGLGLSISHGIASAHGGSLELCPTTIGACFRLALPVAPAAAAT